MTKTYINQNLGVTLQVDTESFCKLNSNVASRESRLLGEDADLDRWVEECLEDWRRMVEKERTDYA